MSYEESSPYVRAALSDVTTKLNFYQAVAQVELGRVLSEQEQAFLFAMDSDLVGEQRTEFPEAIDWFFGVTEYAEGNPREKHYQNMLNDLVSPMGEDSLDEQGIVRFLQGVKHAIQNNGNLVERMSEYSDSAPFNDSNYLTFVQTHTDC